MKLKLLAFLLSYQLYAQNYTLSGFIREEGSKETLPGATVHVIQLKQGTSSSSYGFYSITLAKGEYIIEYGFLGYQNLYDTIVLDKDINLDIYLKRSSRQLEEVEITAQVEESQTAQMGRMSVPIAQLQAVPVLLGEKDVFKVLQFLPGVQGGTEGTSAIYVRGGAADQNLIILDDAVVYNTSHLFGFFSVFNGDAIKDVNLYKGAFPSRFGGRLSSVIDMTMRDGNKDHWTGLFNIGLISSSGVLEGPIKKDKASIIISARRTYLDVLTAPLFAAMSTSGSGGYYFLRYKHQNKLRDKSKEYHISEYI